MKKNTFFNIALLISMSASLYGAAETVDLSETMKNSLVYLQISNSAYDLSQPWKRAPTVKDGGFACAVAPYEILTTAANIADATLVQAMLYSENAFVSARVKTVDYEYNLCLLELDKSAVKKPLTPLSFKESFPKGKPLTAYWLSGGNHLTTARCTLDRAEMAPANISFAQNLTYFATNVSRPFGDGEVCCHQDQPIGMASWGIDSDSGIIPSETINRFLSHCKEKSYAGFGAAGFEVYFLLDPSMRAYLKMPAKLEHGAFVSTVYNIGTGSQELKQSDVLLSIRGQQLNPYGRYKHPEYGYISFHHILSQAPVGESIPVEIFRDGKIMKMDIASKAIESDKMLIPYYIYGKQPEYVVIAGFVFQQLTRDYLQLWGSDWAGNTPPHLYNYHINHSFKPTDERQDIVILSYVLPAPVNQGYQQLSRIVVDSINGNKIASIKDALAAFTAPSESEFIEITFEMDNPVVVIPKASLDTENAKIAQLYGISKMMNVE